jgi:N-acetylmuramoyl-L-alanine amidase
MVFSSGGPYRLKTVVIDAGHGGHDAGCLGASAKEKDVALAIALKLGQYIP